jgi:hypothetical protein
MLNDKFSPADLMKSRFLDDLLSNQISRIILERWGELALPDCWLVAGCLFKTVWNKQSGQPPQANIKDYDLFYFDATGDARFHHELPNVVFTEATDFIADVVITDAWPKDVEAPEWSLAEHHLARMGRPKLLPTPPFTIGRELSFDPRTYDGFAGCGQKQLLVPVQAAILHHVTSFRSESAPAT